MGEHDTVREGIRALERAIGEGYDQLLSREDGSTPLLGAWRVLAALLARRPGLKLRAIDRRMPDESLSLFLHDLIGWLLAGVGRDQALVPVLREVCEAVLARVTPEDDALRQVARAAWVRALDWMDERMAAEVELAAWVHEDPGCARAWTTWSALHCDPGYLPSPDDDPQRALALLEQGLRHVRDPAGRSSLLCQLGNLHVRECRPNAARAAHDAALALHEELCGEHP